MKISKKTAKILNIIVIALALVLIVSNVAMAAATGGSFDGFTDIQAKESTLATKAQEIGGTILGVAQVVGMAVAVIMLVVLAIKYLSSSPDSKAEIKKYAVVYITGAIVLFAASGLVGLMRDYGKNLVQQ